MEKPGLKTFLHFFHNAPSAVNMFRSPANGLTTVAMEGCLSKVDSETCRAISLYLL
jgi:hypothetical protein